MQQVYSNVTKVMVDSRQGSNLLYLPIDKLMQLSGPGGANGAVAPAAGAASGPESSTPTLPASGGAADARSRDGLRSRDRDVR